MIRHVQAAQKAEAALENSLSSSLPPKPEREREREIQAMTGSARGTKLSRRGAKGKNNGLYNEGEWRGAK